MDGRHAGLAGDRPPRDVPEGAAASRKIDSCPVNVDIDNVDVGLRRSTPKHQPSSPNASRMTENPRSLLQERHPCPK